MGLFSFLLFFFVIKSEREKSVYIHFLYSSTLIRLHITSSDDDDLPSESAKWMGEAMMMVTWISNQLCSAASAVVSSMPVSPIRRLS